MADVDLHGIVVNITPSITAGAYAANDLVGAKLELTSAARDATPGGVIQTVCLCDKAAQGIDTDVVFFTADPTGTTFTDNSPLTVADTDLDKVIGIATLTNHKSFADNGISYQNNVGIYFELSSGTTLYAGIVTQGTPTYASTSDLILRVGITQD